MVLAGGDAPRQIAIGMVTSELFDVLGTPLALGRGFSPEEDRVGAERAVVLSFALWRESFGADPEIVGRSVLLDTRPYRVVGVAPRGIDIPEDVDVWVPLGLFTRSMALSRTGHSAGRMVARLAPGVTLDAARAELDTIARAIDTLHPPDASVTGALVTPLAEELVGAVRPALLLLLGAVALVLLIACTNVANLLLVRGAARRRELALRVALGASRWTLVRGLLVESLVLGVAGGGLGLLLAAWGTDLYLALGGDALPRAGGVELSGRVLAFAAALSLATGIGFGVLPALQATRVDPSDGLKESAAGVTRARAARLRRAFVGAQVALALVLLVGAGLLLESFRRVSAISPGFEPARLFTVKTALPGAKYTDDAQVRRFADELLPRLAAIPGVASAALADIPPLSTNYNQMGTVIEGAPARGEALSIDVAAVSAGYFGTLGIPLRAGRDFAAGDGPDAPPVAIVDVAMARHLGADPVGRRLRIGGRARPWLTVVGVVGSVNQSSLETPAKPQIYVPLAQRPSWYLSILLRSAVSPAELQRAAEGAVRALDPGQPVYQPATMEEIVGDTVARRRFSTLLLLGFALAALTLATIGIYGVASFAAATREHEIAIRMALGARGGDVVRLVLRQGMIPVLAGTAAGVLGAIAAAPALAALVYGVEPVEPLALAAIALLLWAVAAGATWLPARRAARIEPMRALRSD
jgi:predicted permease